MDPLADKFLISAALIAFVGLAELHVPAWMVVFIIGRELLITGLRMLAASKGIVIAADRAGKFKTTSQLMAIITILVILCVNSALETFWHLTPAVLLQKEGWADILGRTLTYAPFWLVFIATLFTIISGLSYFNKHKVIFAAEAGIKL